jgi:excisionase family DNA binding protein
VSEELPTTFYSVTEVAARFGVKPPTVREWIKQGKLKAAKRHGAKKKGHLMISDTDLREYVNSIYGEPDGTSNTAASRV